MSAGTDLIRDYHELTKHAPGHHAGTAHDERLVRGYRPMDRDRQPPQFKTYPGLDSVPVPPALDDVLYLSAGATRYVDKRDGGRMYFRAAGSAGNLSPLELYVIDAGTVAHYEPIEHRLTPIGTAAEGPTTIVITGVPWRTSWKYTERGFRHLYWDCGSLLAQLLALAPEARLQLGFVDADVARLVGADGTHEFPLAAVVLGDGQPPLAPPASTTNAPPTGHLADDPIEFPLITAAQRAGDLAGPDAVTAWRAADARPSPTPSTLTFGQDLRHIIRRRGSTRVFDRDAQGPVALLIGAFEAATARLPADFVDDDHPTLATHDVIVHNIVGHRPGTYRWQGDHFERTAFVDDPRAAGSFLCLGQPLGGDGCYTAFHGTDLDATLDRFGPRGYRAAQLEAGIVEGRLHLAAFALGFGATGLTFHDDAAGSFLATTAAPMLVTAVGKPKTRAPLAGPPGQPVRIPR